MTFLQTQDVANGRNRLKGQLPPLTGTTCSPEGGLALKSWVVLVAAPLRQDAGCNDSPWDPLVDRTTKLDDHGPGCISSIIKFLLLSFVHSSSIPSIVLGRQR